MRSGAVKKASPLTLSGEIKLQGVPSQESSLNSGLTERRAKPRIKHAFPARIWGNDRAGQPFEIVGVLDNISSTGLYLRTQRELRIGLELSLIIKFINNKNIGATALLRGQILRLEPQPDGRNGIALAIKEYHFI